MELYIDLSIEIFDLIRDDETFKKIHSITYSF